MEFVENVIPFLASKIADGQHVCLVTLVHVEGSSPRPLGSQIGVASDGTMVGMITGGCAEKAIAAEAQICLEAGENRLVRYGTGSAYVDVILPCGSGIDLYFDVTRSPEIIVKLHQNLSARQSAIYTINTTDLTSKLRTNEDTTLTEGFFKRYLPDYRLFVFGEGPNLTSLARLAVMAGFDVKAFSPDEETLGSLAAHNITAQPIHRSFAYHNLEIDDRTAVITVFHEHEWEIPILHAALNSQADYIGALGSRRTHQQRLETLSSLPKTHQPPDQIYGPVGLDIGAQNPNEIALSILAQIIAQRTN